MRVSSARGSPTLVFARRSASACSTASRYCGRRHRAADCGAFLPRLDRHLGRDFLDEQVEFGRARRRVGPEQRGIEAVLLGDEADRFANDRRMGAKLERGRSRAGEADDVLAGQMVEQIADAADDQLDGARRQDVRLDHDAECGFAQIGGCRRRLHDRRNAREQGRRELLEHAPDREVEGVDVHRRALERGIDVLADERACLRQALELAVEQDVRVGQLAAALGREGEERPGAALDVDPAVLAGRAGQIVELVQLLLARHDRGPSALIIRARSWNVILRSAGPPTSRAWLSIRRNRVRWSRSSPPARRRSRSGFRRGCRRRRSSGRARN